MASFTLFLTAWMNSAKENGVRIDLKWFTQKRKSQKGQGEPRVESRHAEWDLSHLSLDKRQRQPGTWEHPFGQVTARWKQNWLVLISTAIPVCIPSPGSAWKPSQGSGWRSGWGPCTAEHRIAIFQLRALLGVTLCHPKLCYPSPSGAGGGFIPANGKWGGVADHSWKRILSDSSLVLPRLQPDNHVTARPRFPSFGVMVTRSDRLWAGDDPSCGSSVPLPCTAGQAGHRVTPAAICSPWAGDNQQMCHLGRALPLLQGCWVCSAHPASASLGTKWVQSG